MKTKLAFGLIFTGALFLHFQNSFAASLTEESIAVAEEIDSDLDDVVAPSDVEDAGAMTGLCPVRTSNQIPLPLKEIQKGGSTPVVLGKGHYYHQGELHLTSPVVIKGQGRGLTKITLCIGPKDAGIRIESKDVTITGISIELALTDKLLNGGSGEYGTGITIGRYFDRKALVPASNIKIENVGVSRGKLANGSRSWTGNAIVAIGNVSDVIINDVVLYNSHSIGFLAHWGGSLVSDCKYGHAYEIFEDDTEKMRCPLVRTYHPHNIKVDGLATAPLTNSLLMISSSYNIDVTNVSGSAPLALQILPGDEGVRYSTDAEKSLVGSGIRVDKVVASITQPRSENPDLLPIMRIFSKGGSKWDGSYNEVFYRNVTVSNFDITATSEERSNFRQRKYSLVSKYTHGQNIKFINIDFNDAGRARGYSFGAALLYSKGISLSGIKTQAKNGVLVRNSEDIEIKDSVIRRTNVVATAPGLLPAHYSRGIMITDGFRNKKEGPYPGYANVVKVSNNIITNYDVGVWIASIDFPNIVDMCDRVSVAADNQATAFLAPYRGKTCD